MGGLPLLPLAHPHMNIAQRAGLQPWASCRALCQQTKTVLQIPLFHVARFGMA